MGLGSCLAAYVRIQTPCHPDGTILLNQKTGAKARSGTPESSLEINTLGALSLALTYSKAFCAEFGIPEAIGITNISGDFWMSSSISHDDKEFTKCPT